ncbi:hypothetical protein VRG37_03217 [Klebsiella pneumoniae]|nr:Uncharacterised protein [Klebsiella pneumoniae]
MVLQFANIPLRRRRKQLINKGIINMDVLMKALSFVGKKMRNERELLSKWTRLPRRQHYGNWYTTPKCFQ